MSIFLTDDYQRWQSDTGTGPKPDAEHVRFESYSVRWNWRAGAQLRIPLPPGGYYRPDPTLYGKSHPTFSFWIYSFAPGADRLLFEFSAAGRVCCSFDYKLDFSGWRTGWISFLRDMNGTPDEQMDLLTIRAPREPERGSFCFDQMLLCAMINPRFHMRDRQLPHVNPGADVKANRHWMGLYGFSLLEPEPEKPVHVPIETFVAIENIENQLLDYFQEEYPPPDHAPPDDPLAELGLSEVAGELRGPPPVYAAMLDILPPEWRERNRKALAHNTYANYARVLWQLAAKIKFTPHPDPKVETMLIKLLRFMFMHGWTAGSGMGTLYHFGYAMRQLAPALLLVKSILRRHKVLKPAAAMLRWLSGTGRIYAYPYLHGGVSPEALGLQAPAMLISILLNDEAREKVR
ncbi:MAG: chondroitinase family protein, partial [Victivallales bacterium]|nr:chondroitinase family protein [Victivallales bacterium]